jgi:hypothetical protein
MLNIYCNPSNPNSFIQNTIYNKLYAYYKTKVDSTTISHIKQEDISGFSNNHRTASNFFLIFTYVMIVYNDYVSGIYTYEQLKEKHNFDKYEKCFSCVGFSLDKMFELVGIVPSVSGCVGINTLGVSYNWQVGHKNCLDNVTPSQQNKIDISTVLVPDDCQILLTSDC